MTTFKPNSTLTQEHLKSLLSYEKDTGVFTWRVAHHRIRVGMTAGSLSKEGYIRITVARRRFMAHALAWLYMTGEYVVRGIDHRDTVRNNNRWTNLRRATLSQNSMNVGVRSDNALGIKCVQRKKGKNVRPFYATITFDGRQRQLGYFDTIEEAAESYRIAALKHFGEFARTK